MKNKEVESDYIEIANPIDDIESGYYQRLKMVDLADEEAWPLEALQFGGSYWLNESGNRLRSRRSRKECKHIAKMFAFEVAYRSDRVDELIAYYQGGSSVE